MITEKGKEIIGKYLLGQTSHYAEYLAIGCGYNQLLGQTWPYPVEDLDRQNLNFEMLRVPIISRGINTDENGVTSLIFKAELPTEQRFKITEVGVFSDQGNVRAGLYDSKRISGFLPSEGWVDKNSAAIPEVTSSIVDSNGEIIDDFIIGYVTDENSAWEHPDRKQTLQPPRYFDRSVLARGDLSDIDRTTNPASDADVLAAPTGGTNFIKTNKLVFNMNENNAEDIIRLAWALIPKVPADTTIPTHVMIIVDFLNEYSNNTSYARWYIHKDPADFVGTDNETYYYKIEEALKQDFVISSSSFSWAAINGVRIFASVQDNSGVLQDDWHVLLDGLRLENVSSENPLYGLVGYKVIDTDSGQPVIKQNNTVNFIEFRYTVQV